ncbi:MAG: polysaccharide deacetylase family protein [Syntrophales bacterium]
MTFHDILPETLDSFRANLHFLKQNTNVVSLDNFFSGESSTNKISVVITFDDGYKSWITDVLPLLKKLGLPAIFFVSSGFVGLSEYEETEFIRTKLFAKLPPRRISGSLSYADVRKLADDGFTIGGHTLNHCDLGELRDLDRLRYEIAEDKLRLERMTGSRIDYFSYPFGIYQNPGIDISAVIRELGYRGAVTTVSGFNSARTNPYLLHRELTASLMSERVFRARVYGNYEAIRYLKKIISFTMTKF